MREVISFTDRFMGCKKFGKYIEIMGTEWSAFVFEIYSRSFERTLNDVFRQMLSESLARLLCPKRI